MNVFLAGGSGVIGRRLIPRLVDAGHEVTATTRSPERAGSLSALGARGVVCDVFDVERLRALAGEAEPEVVVSQLTAIPKALDPRKVKTQLEPTNRLRTEGTRNVLEAARAAGARRAVVQSVAFAYRPEARRIAREEDPLHTDCPASFRDMLSAVQETERLALQSSEMEGIVLRYGFFYGPGTIYADDGSFTAMVRRRIAPIVGRGRGVFSFIHIDDAADATARAVESKRTGLYNIVDDEPAAVAEWLPVFARAAGAKPPRRVPTLLGWLGAGRYGVHLMCRQVGATNLRARQELGWTPAHASWRTGFVSELRGAAAS